MGSSREEYLLIILIHISNEDYQTVISKDYSYHLDIYPNEISAFSFNDFLVFSATYQNNGIISALLFFGYPK